MIEMVEVIFVVLAYEFEAHKTHCRINSFKCYYKIYNNLSFKEEQQLFSKFVK